MSRIAVRRLEEGVYRIFDGGRGDDLLLERYGLVASLPEGDEASAVPDCPFECRWEGWREERDRLERQFPLTGKRQIEGRPGEQAPGAVFLTPEADGGFALRFHVSPGERFYGLGEGARDSLCLNGRAYQNYARYQQDEIPIPFLMSDRGWGLLLLADGRHFVDVDSQKDGFVRCLGYEALDALVFRAQDMAGLLSLYARYTGKSAVLPRWAYGLTYIAPIFASQFDVLRDAERMRDLGIPCRHFSLEPGWMEKFYDMSLDKQWCLERFHMPSWFMDGKHPDTFIHALKRMGIHLSLWYCVDYDFTDEAERQAGLREKNAFAPWYDHMGRQVTAGVDGFKLDPANMLDPYLLTRGQRVDPRCDCANGRPYARVHNVMQVLLARQVHEGFVRQTGRRPMLHYCGGYTGIQRWCAATTGDNGGDLGAMIWLLTLALSGQSNTTVDMNVFSPESQHFAFFAPWAHLNAWSGVRQPWYAGEKMQDLFVRYARLRSRLLPYIYSAALEAHRTGLPIIRPMPLAFPGYEPTMEVTRQYLFGPALMVGAYAQELRLPPGAWRDAWTGEALPGGQTAAAAHDPAWGGTLLIREGAIIPTQEDGQSPEVTLHLFPGREGESEYTLYEDDGESVEYLTGAVCATKIVMRATGEGVLLSVGRGAGDYAGKPEKRRWRVCLHDERPLTVCPEAAGDEWTQIPAPEGLQL